MNSRKLHLTLLLFCLLWISLSQQSALAALQFHFIYPDGEGDEESATPYIESLFSYLKEQTGIEFTGKYVNDSDDAKELLNNSKPSLAIIENQFLESLDIKPETLLKTIPVYSSGPFERLYILSGGLHLFLMNPLVQNKEHNIKLYASRSYSQKFLKDKIFGDNPIFKNVKWQVEEKGDILSILKKVSSGDLQGMILLSGYEHFVVKELIKRNEKFSKLKLVYSSPDLPTSPLVLIDNASLNKAQLTKLKTALVGMSKSLKGQVILKNLRLKGFVE